MPEEKNLTAVNTVTDVDKIRVVTSEGMSHSIEVNNLKSSLLINDLPDRVVTLESKADTNEENHSSIDSRIEELASVVGKRAEGGTPASGLFQEISGVRTDLAGLRLEEVERLDGELDEVRADITLMNGTNGQLAILTEKVEAGLKIIDEPPISASAAGQLGEVYLSSEYFYVCVGTDTWKRIPLEDW